MKTERTYRAEYYDNTGKPDGMEGFETPEALIKKVNEENHYRKFLMVYEDHYNENGNFITRTREVFDTLQEFKEYVKEVDVLL